MKKPSKPFELTTTVQIESWRQRLQVWHITFHCVYRLRKEFRRIEIIKTLKSCNTCLMKRTLT